MSRLRDAGEASPATIRKGVEVAAILSCGMLAPVAVAASAAIHSLLGPGWTEAAALMPWLCLGLAIDGAMGVMVSGYLMADDAPGAVLGVNVIFTVLMLGVALPLLRSVGYGALAAAFVVAHLVSALALDRALAPATWDPHSGSGATVPDLWVGGRGSWVRSEFTASGRRLQGDRRCSGHGSCVRPPDSNRQPGRDARHIAPGGRHLDPQSGTRPGVRLKPCPRGRGRKARVGRRSG